MSKHSIDDEKPLRSGPGDFDRFIKSAVWYDMQELVKDRINLLQKEFLTVTSIDEIRNIQGQMKAWNEMLGLPAYLKSCAHSEQKPEQLEIDL